MEKKSFYWWVIYVIMSSTLLMMCVYLVRKNLSNSKVNYPVSFVNKFAFSTNEHAIKNLACDTVDSMAIYKKILSRVKRENIEIISIDKVNRPITKENKGVKTSCIKVTAEAKARAKAKAKALSAYLRNRRIGHGITNSEVIISEEANSSVIPVSVNNLKTKDKVPIYDNPSKRSVNDKNIKFVSQNNLSAMSSADYKISDIDKEQGLKNKEDITINQSVENNLQNDNVSGVQSISTLLKTYNEYQSIRNSTISYSVDGSLEFVDITSTDLISSQLPNDNVNSPLVSKPMGAKNADEDPLDGGGGVDNGTVYNDSGGGPSLPVGDGTSILFVLLFTFINIKKLKYQYNTSK